MPDVIRCPNCPASLRVPPAAVGKAIRCPKCKAVVPIPAAPLQPPPMMTAELLPLPDEEPSADVELLPEESAAPPALADEPPPERPPTSEPKKRKAKGKSVKPYRWRWLPRIALGSIDIRLALLYGIPLFGLAAVGVGLYLALRAIDPPTIPAENWETVEVLGRFRAKLPGSSVKRTTSRLGPGMEVYVCEPNETSLYLVGCSRDLLPTAQLERPPNKALDTVCDSVISGLSGLGWKEIKREPTQGGLHEGKLLVASVFVPRSEGYRIEKRIPGGYLTSSQDGYMQRPQGAWAAWDSGKVIARYHLAYGRVFVVLAGGPSFEARQENVKRLFDSFEILDPPPPDAG